MFCLRYLIFRAKNWQTLKATIYVDLFYECFVYFLFWLISTESTIIIIFTLIDSKKGINLLKVWQKEAHMLDRFGISLYLRQDKNDKVNFITDYVK